MVRDLETGEETPLTGPLGGDLQPRISDAGDRVVCTDSDSRTGYLAEAGDGAAPTV